MLRLKPILQTLATRTHNLAPRRRQHLLLLPRLLDLGPGVHEAGHEADDDGADGAERDGRVEENEARERDGQFVEGADHAVRR